MSMTSDATSYSAKEHAVLSCSVVGTWLIVGLVISSKEGHNLSPHFIAEFGCLSLPSSMYLHFALCANIANEYS